MYKVELPITCAETDGIMSLEGPQQDLSTLKPDDLRDQVQKALSRLCEADSKAARQRLLAGLAMAGVHVGATLFMLGIPATSLDDPTPSDLGMLLRYIRINTPTAIKALNGVLSELLAAKEELEIAARRIDEAA